MIKIDETFAISKIVAGCMRIADKRMEGKSLLTFVEECVDLGVTTFDHAPVYGGYICEELFGNAVLRQKPELRKNIQLITKTGIVLAGARGNETIFYKSTRKQILQELDESLKKLGTDYIDVLLIHRPDLLADPTETAEVLDSLIKAGKIRYAGVSNYMPSQVALLQDKMAAKLVINQAELSVKATDNYFNGVTDDALRRQMVVMAWSPLGGGSVFVGEDEQSIRLRSILDEIANKYNAAMDTVMYAWLFTHPAPTAVITGSMNIRRVKRAVEAINFKLSYDEWYRILEASRGYSVP